MLIWVGSQSCNHDAFHLVIRYTVQKCALFHYPSLKPALKREEKSFISL